MDKSQLFTMYNLSKAAIRAGEINTTEVVANRALGLGQRKEPRPYITTVDDCDCNDHRYRERVCKHMLTERMKAGVIA